jgi:hypothetical protein
MKNMINYSIVTAVFVSLLICSTCFTPQLHMQMSWTKKHHHLKKHIHFSKEKKVIRVINSIDTVEKVFKSEVAALTA